ncbi:MAG: hypothetical protein AB8B61_05735 [Cyclobacteriaceae bacterium]
MKKILVICTLAFFILPASAQNTKGKKRGEVMISKMKENLSLTNDQVAKVESFQKKQKKEIEALKAQKKKLKIAFDANLKSILTDEQYKKHLALKAERKEKRKDCHK